ncbi:MAG: DUF262 domain-containing protein [Desulfomonile tiedjei]|nr:DUF262 domain-containing protein [Desulfomonile tiedjei]
MDRVEYEKLIIQDLINLHKSGDLELNPWYQRRSVWKQPQKAYLINTLFEQKPIPSIYIRHSLDLDAEKSIREVVDGQQRIRAILEFVDGVFVASHPAHTHKVKYSQLKRTEAEHFKLTSISVGYLLGATDGDVIEIFGRLNSVAKTLNAQEKRNARFSGEYKQFCLRQAAHRLPMWRSLNIFTANDIARMAEVQFVSDLALNFLNGLSDYSQIRLDKIYKQYDEEFPRQEEIKQKFEDVFSGLAEIKPTAIRDTSFRRQPLFFSLCVALGVAQQRLPPDKLESALHAIDEILSADIPLSDRKREEALFVTACTASTQRIKQRQIRDSFIKKNLGIRA